MALFSIGDPGPVCANMLTNSLLMWLHGNMKARGYRIMPGRSALILRKGPGLIVTTTNQKQFAISLDDPETPAALLATLRDDNLTALRAATKDQS